MDDTVLLVTVGKTQDDYGVERQSTSSREVFCKVSSVTRSEFFGAGRSGLNPELVFTVFRGDYSGEPLIRYHGRDYSIYRTYMTDDDYLELYAQRKGGTNGTTGKSTN